MSPSVSRSPHGERGLKFIIMLVLHGICLSLPARGAWIEIFVPPPLLDVLASLPARGAWIEIRKK